MNQFEVQILQLKWCVIINIIYVYLIILKNGIFKIFENYKNNNLKVQLIEQISDYFTNNLFNFK
jgi:hypothetical protein